ncbi:MAG: Smr/MutS family protein [Kordiimonadaceae bacterium]|nr:Smr/MutS family protein [Kordiimonadaceae bacterium]
MAKKPRKPAVKAPALPANDKALWNETIKTITPLSDRPDAPAVKPLKMLERLDGARPLPMEWHIGESPDPVAYVDRKTKRRLAKGKIEVDGSIDLHGLTQEQALGKLRSMIEGAVRRGEKTLLVVTGKGGARFSQTGDDGSAAYRTRADFDQFGGVLKRMVPVWLSSGDLRPFIESYGSAAQEHGGEGAMYIRLRKRIPGSRRSKGRGNT